MDLPTYTNIWRIEKRLYKLYDLRLPMPLPLVQIGVFVGVFVPWILLLRLVGIPFASPWHVLYLVPPGVLTWMATRPVIEGKRLTELLLSQSRYLAEPRTWCRLTPIREPGEVMVVARVWRRGDSVVQPAAVPERAAIRADRKARKARRGRAMDVPVRTAAARTAEAALAEIAQAAHRPQPLAEYAAQAGTTVEQTQSDWPGEQAGHPHFVPGSGAAAPPPRERVRSAERARPATAGRPVQATGQAPGAERRAVRPWRAGVERDISHEPDYTPPPAEPPAVAFRPQQPPVTVPHGDEHEHEHESHDPEVERPPATPVLEVPPPREPAQGSGKRALASGVLRSGNAAEFWTAISPENAPRPATAPSAGAGEDEDAGDGHAADIDRPDRSDEVRRADRPGSVGERPGPAVPVTRPDIPMPRPTTTTPDIPMVPGAFGAAGQTGPADYGHLVAGTAAPTSRTGADDGPGPARAPGTPPRAAEEAQAEEAQAGEAQAGEAQAGEEAGAAGEADDAARPEPVKEPVAESGREPIREPAVKPPSKPWSTELSRPRTGDSDSLVWPPSGPLPGSAGQPATLPSRSGPGRPVKPPPPRVVPESRPPMPEPWEQAGSSEPAAPWGRPEPAAPPPAREVRSGPASPVRPRPLPQPAAPPASGPAIMPPDPEQEPHGGGGLRRLLKAVGGGHGDADSEWEERLQRPFQGTRHIVVLGCTGGAGQTVTALMLGHTFAHHGGEPAVAIDVNPGPGALARRTRSETNETLTGLITRADQVSSLTAMRRYTSRAKSGLDVVAAGKNPLHALDDRDYALAIRTIDRFYSVTLLDTAAAVVARVLPHADQLVLVAPASSDAPRAVAMTFEWLDGHGYHELRSRAVTVINGVSRRSMDDVEQAEAVARGRCRALVRIPWDDHLSLDRSPRNELKSLRAPTRRAYLALAGVVAGGFGEVPERYREQEQEASR